jgi:hypothetical protein
MSLEVIWREFLCNLQMLEFIGCKIDLDLIGYGFVGEGRTILVGL